MKTKRTVCMLKGGLSVYANDFRGECGRHRGGLYVSLWASKVTCPNCVKKTKGGQITWRKSTNINVCFAVQGMN